MVYNGIVSWYHKSTSHQTNAVDCICEKQNTLQNKDEWLGEVVLCKQSVSPADLLGSGLILDVLVV